MTSGGRTWVGHLAVLAALAGAGCSCPYLRNRGRDAGEMIDWGFVTSKRPHFAIFNDYCNVVPLGYSHVEGTFHGIGNKRVGSMPIRINYWGVLAWGSLNYQLGEFDINNPYQVSPEWIAGLKAANQKLPTTTPRYHIGFLRMALEDDVPPRRTGFM